MTTVKFAEEEINIDQGLLPILKFCSFLVSVQTLDEGEDFGEETKVKDTLLERDRRGSDLENEIHGELRNDHRTRTIDGSE